MGAKEMAQSVECLLGKHEALSLHLQLPHKKSGIAVCVPNPCTRTKRQDSP